MRKMKDNSFVEFHATRQSCRAKRSWELAKGAIAIILTLNILGWNSSASACSCDSPDGHKGALDRSDYTFIGKVVSTDDTLENRPRRTARFIVSQIWKGKTQRYITVWTSTGMCGPRFQVGQEYLVYAHSNPDGLSTSVCSLTSHLMHVDFLDLIQLGDSRLVY
jgi:hypothetical protein